MSNCGIFVIICIGGEGQKTSGTWRERIQKWKEILRGEKFSEELDSQSAKYVVEFDMKEVEESLRKDVVGKVTETEGTRALWIAKRWWLYRPKLPYTYFLDKLDSSEVISHSPLLLCISRICRPYQFIFKLPMTRLNLYENF